MSDNSIQMQSQDRIRREARAFAAVMGVTVVVLVASITGMWVWSASLSPDPIRDAAIAAAEAQKAEAARLAELGPPGPQLDLHSVARGQRLYNAACIVCHGADGKGVAKMGKDLVNSAYTKRTSDADLVAMISTGREISDPRNTMKMLMPARGGRPDYSDAYLADVVAYVRSLQDPRRVTGTLPEVKVAILDDDTEETAVASVTPTEPSAGNNAATSPNSEVKNPDPGTTPATTDTAVALDPEAVKRGKKVYSSCLACHGRTGSGVPKMGADLLHSDFVKKHTDSELLEFVKKGRQPGEPDSKMNLMMPSKGGNPALKDNQIQDVIVYIRSLQQAAAEKK